MWRFRALGRVALDVSNWLLPLAAINLVWCVLSLTVIMMPPATAALFEVAYQARKGHGPSMQSFLESIRRWLLRAWLWGAGCLLTGVVAVVALSFYGAQQTSFGAILLVIAACVAVLIIGVQFYFWPYMLAQDEPHIRRALRNAAFTLFADPLNALLYGGIALALLAAGAVLIVPMVLIAPITVAFLAVYSLREWLDHHRLLEALSDDDPASQG